MTASAPSHHHHALRTGDEDVAREALATVLMEKVATRATVQPTIEAAVTTKPELTVPIASSVTQARPEPAPEPETIQPQSAGSGQDLQDEETDEIEDRDDGESEDASWRAQVQFFYSTFYLDLALDTRGSKLHGFVPCYCIKYGAELSTEVASVLGFSNSSVFLLRESAVHAGMEEDAVLMQRRINELVRVVSSNEDQFFRLEFGVCQFTATVVCLEDERVI
eukprot:SAG31_NODE_450_length_15512_cov_5.788555_18_plen_222_part_00